MNNERNNLGVNNDLPPMGTMIDNTSENKLNLPPISSFTDFGDGSVSSDNNVSSNNANAAIFNLMDQFDQVSSNNINQSSNQPLPSQPINSNNVQDNLVSNEQPSINDNSFINQPVNNVNIVPTETQTPISNVNGINHLANNINQGEVQSQTQSFNMNNQEPQVQQPVFNMNNEVNSFGSSQPEVSVANMNGMNQQVNSVNQGEVQSQTPFFNMNNQVQQVNNVANETLQTQAPIFNMNSETNQSVNNAQFQTSSFNTNMLNQELNNVSQSTSTPLFNTNNNVPDMNNQSVPNMNDIQNIKTEPMNNESNDLLTHAPIINNQEEELISKFSMDESLDNSVNSQNKEIIEPSTTTNNPNLNNIDNKKVNNKKEKKSKSKKMLFIILLVITIILVGVAFIICYFKFIKTDKLVCSLQDYSNEQFLVEESMVMNFKGSNLVNANLKRNLTFVESYMDSKETYLEELRNQFGGLGFDVSYSENDTGFEMNMNFTKQELENWYGSTLKNSSKNNMLKEMKDVGYTCK